MSLERLELLIRSVREQTGNQNYSATAGIPQRNMVRHFNDGQEYIYNQILQERSTLFKKPGFIDVVQGQASYALPTDVYLQHNIQKVDYTPTGDIKNYYPLNMRTPREEISIPGYPEAYFLRDGNIILSPIPDRSITNGLRLNYQYVIPYLDIRRAQVMDSDYDPVDGTVTSIDLLVNSYITAETTEELNGSWVDYVCIVDKNGNILMKDLPVESYDDGVTKTLNIDSSFVAATGETLPANAFVVFGKNTTTHSLLPIAAKKCLLTFVELRTQMADSNSDAVETSPIMQALVRDLLDSIAELEEDIWQIPIINYDLI
jgi:hypothetical protein